MNIQSANDDEERVISDDPILSALDADLRSALKTTDHRLFFFIGAALILLFFPRYIHVPSWAMYGLAFASVVTIIGGIVYTIWSSIQRQLAVGVRYGLQCDACGRAPKVSQIMQAAELRKCPACRHTLAVRLPPRNTQS